MTRKKSNVKALALAVTCAILAGGGIGLEPVYAEDVTLNVSNGKITAGSVSGNINGTVGGTAITGGNLSGGTFTGTVKLTDSDIKTVIDGVDISKAKVGSDTNSLTIGGLATAVETNKNSINTLNSTVGSTSHAGSLVHKTQKITYAAETGTSIDGVVLNNKGISAADGNFTVNGTNAETVVSGDNGKTTIYGGGINVEGANGNGHVAISSGSVTADVSVTSKIITDLGGARMEGGKVVAKNGLYIGANNIVNPTKDNSKFSVDGGSGDTTVGGALTVNGAANFVQETTFANGIKTDKIEEATHEAGVTVDGVVLKDKGITAADGAFKVDGENGTVKTTGNIQGANITATGALNGASLDVTGNATVGGTLDVTGKTTLKDALEVKGKATFGNAPGAMTEIDGDKFTTGVITTAEAQESNIGGVKMRNGTITADNMTIAGTLDMENLKVKNELTVGTFGVTKAGVVTGVTFINDVAVSKQGTGLKIGSATVGDSNPFSSQGYTVDATGNVSAKDITAGKYNGNEITADKKFNGVELNGGNVKATNVTADTITGGNVVAKKITADTAIIAGVNFAASGSVSGINDLTAKTIKDGAGTIITGGNVKSQTANIGAINIDNETIEGSAADGLSIEGVKIKDGVMSSVVSIDAAKATIGGVNTLDNTGLTVKTGSKVQVGTNTVIEDGSVKVSQKTSLTDQSLQLNDTNKWTQTGGLVADKATVNGIALGTDSKGKATFSDAAGNTTTIDGNKITTGTITADELNVDKISLGKGTDKNITIGSNGDVTTKGNVTVTGADDDTTVIDGAKATFGKDAANQTTIDKGKISAKAKSKTNQIAEFGFDENGLTVSGQNAAGQKSSFSFNAKTGTNTFTGQDGTTTTINGSAITSTKAIGDTGVLDGSNLTLKKGVHSTVMTAGGVTFTGKQGASTQHGDTTTIDGGIITTDTLKVQRIQLGEKIVDERTGKEIGSGVTLAADGGFTAAGGNFKVVGGATGSRGSITNVVGDDNSGKTVFETNQQGANMSFKKGGVTSNVSVGESKANVSAGNASIDVVNGSITDKVGGTTVKTKDGSFSVEGNTANGMKINTNTGETTFTGAAGEKGGNTTTINGGNITTDTLNVERINLGGEMVDKNGTSFGSNLSMDAKGNFSAAGGKFKINGADGAMTNTVGKTSFATSDDGVNSSVTQDDTHKSEFNQGLTSIGGVVTNGEIKVAQKLDGATGLLTNEVTDANGSSKLVQNGTGLEYTDSAKLDNATRIDSSDVSIGSATEPDKRINLSDLGQIDELDKELTDRDEYKNNPTAVGGINAEAAIRREEVARLDGRINDVNDRVNKVGAMAAAIASLKSIGYDPQAPSEFSIGLGQYKGETGVAMGFFHYPNKNFMINVSLSTAGGETMGGIGATWRFGHKSPQKLLEEQREAQAKKELAAAEKYQAAAKLAKEAQERAEYAAKLARQAQVSADNAKAAADATQAKHFG